MPILNEDELKMIKKRKYRPLQGTDFQTLDLQLQDNLRTSP